MKTKALLIPLTMILSTILQAQEISPYYPCKVTINNPYYFSSQITYFDMNSISDNISDFLLHHMNMNVSKRDHSKLLRNGGAYIITYTDELAQSRHENLIFNYNIGLVDNVLTIKSLKITGSKKRLISFFNQFWMASKDFKSASGKSEVSFLTGQDVATFYTNKEKLYITVTNNNYKSLNEFNAYFQNLKLQKMPPLN